MNITLFGLKKCSTCAKAQKWLVSNGYSVDVSDVRENPPSAEQLMRWSAIVGWDTLINRRSQTWRSLSSQQQQRQSEAEWLALVQAFPTLMKRPLLEKDGHIILGFSEARYQSLLQS